MKTAFGVCVCVYLSLVSEWFKVFYSYLSLSIRGQWLLYVNIPPPEIEAIQMGPKIQSGDFHKKRP
jgi:hypothetical protein